jgi:hypothetical protein
MGMRHELELSCMLCAHAPHVAHRCQPAPVSHCLLRFILRNSSDVSTGTTYYQLPAECPSNNEASGHSRPCTGSNFIPQAGQGCTVYTNHQELRVQEQMQCLEPGSVPASIVVTVQDELADCCQPGGEPHLIACSSTYGHACRAGAVLLLHHTSCQ